MSFVYMKIPLRHASGEAADALHRALDRALSASGLGTLLGWGTSLPSANAREDDPDAFHRIDVTLRDAGDLDAFRALLPALALPDGTRLHFSASGVAMQQTLGGGDWGRAAPSEPARLSSRFPGR